MEISSHSFFLCLIAVVTIAIETADDDEDVTGAVLSGTIVITFTNAKMCNFL